MNINLIKKFDSLKKYSIIACPRSGSDYFNSLMDSHPSILTLPGHLILYTTFFKKINFNDSSVKNIKKTVVKFIKYFHDRLNTSLDREEGMNKLGKNKNEYINVSKKFFFNNLVFYLCKKTFTKRNFYLGVYFAYNRCLKKILKIKKFYYFILII